MAKKKLITYDDLRTYDKETLIQTILKLRDKFQTQQARIFRLAAKVDRLCKSKVYGKAAKSCGPVSGKKKKS